MNEDATVFLALTSSAARGLLKDEDLNLGEHWADPAETDCWLCHLADQLRVSLDLLDEEAA